MDAELHREVALKEILPEQADNPVSRARFLLEAEVTGRSGASGNRAGVRARCHEPGTPLLRDAVRARREPQGGHRRLPRVRRVSRRGGDGPATTPVPVPGRVQHDGVRAQSRDHPPRSQAGEHHAGPVRRDPGRRLGPGQGRRPRRRPGRAFGRGDDPAGERLGQQRDRGGHGHGHAGLHEPGAGGGTHRIAGPGQRHLQPRRNALQPPDRPAPLCGARRDRGDPQGPAGRLPAAEAGRSPGPAGARGRGAQGHGAPTRRPV